MKKTLIYVEDFYSKHSFHFSFHSTFANIHPFSYWLIIRKWVGGDLGHMPAITGQEVSPNDHRCFHFEQF